MRGYQATSDVLSQAGWINHQRAGTRVRDPLELEALVKALKCKALALRFVGVCHKDDGRSAGSAKKALTRSLPMPLPRESSSTRNDLKTEMVSTCSRMAVKIVSANSVSPVR